MEILTEFDELQSALSKVNMDEVVLPYVNGKLVDSDIFNKVQKILNCPEMISAHKYLYNLDIDQLTDDETSKINQLYKLGVDRGFIIDDLTDWDAQDDVVDQAAEEVTVQAANPTKPQNTLFKTKVPCWTVIYSATKDGDIKTGEAYSNAVSLNAAKADVNAKLSQCGYDNITILAIENCTDAPQPFTSGSAPALDEADDEGKGDDDKASEEAKEKPAGDEGNEDDVGEGGDEKPEGDEDETPGDEGDEDDAGKPDEEGDEDSDEPEEKEEEDEGDEDSDEETSDDEPADDKEKSSEDDEGDEDDEGEELDANKKAELRDLYRKTFRNTLVKCKFDTSFNDLTLDQKVKFFTELVKVWKDDEKPQPQEFMTDKEIEQLNKIVVDEGVLPSSSTDDDEEEEEKDTGDEDSED